MLLMDLIYRYLNEIHILIAIILIYMSFLKVFLNRNLHHFLYYILILLGLFNAYLHLNNLISRVSHGWLMHILVVSPLFITIGILKNHSPIAYFKALFIIGTGLFIYFLRYYIDL